MKIFVTDMDGHEHAIDAFEDWRVMELIRDGGLPILGQCGGACACATCHVYVDPAWLAKIDPPSEEELAMLDGAFEVKQNSRLSCQILFTKWLDGLKVAVAPGSVA